MNTLAELDRVIISSCANMADFPALRPVAQSLERAWSSHRKEAGDLGHVKAFLRRFLQEQGEEPEPDEALVSLMDRVARMSAQWRTRREAISQEELAQEIELAGQRAYETWRYQQPGDWLPWDSLPAHGKERWYATVRPLVEHREFVYEGYEQELRPLCAAARKVLTAFNGLDPGDVKPSTYTAFLNVLPDSGRREKAQERTPETVLRAMLRAYNDSATELLIEWYRMPGDGEETDGRAKWQRLEHVLDAADALRHSLGLLLNDFDTWRLDIPADDYEARLSGQRPLDAPPLEGT